ncbi:MAG: choice-of-anchor D domain-containing protein [Burkholderiales bacterium]|nr:choice-of-anchor D domain-containing protein [Burkholderiales bacterium]
MAFLRGVLTSAQLSDLAAYIANPAAGNGSPAASVSATSLTYASTNVGSTAAAQTVTLSNTGTAALTLGATTISGDFAVSSNTCTSGSSVAAGGSCSVSVTFTPTAAGARSGSLTIAHNATPSTSTVTLSGTGAAVGSPAASVSPAQLSFGSTTVGATAAAQSVTLTNTGNAALVLGTTSIAGADFAVGSNSCTSGSSLAAGASCNVSVSFTPSAPGARSATLTITHNASPASSSVTLSGTGAAAGAPAASVSPTQLTFGSTTVGTTAAAQTVTLTNTGNAALVLGTTAIAGSDFAVGSNTCTSGSSLAASASCTISVSFAPTAAGSRSGTLTIAHNATPASSSVSLTGTGVPAGSPGASLSALQLTFSSTNVGATSGTQSVTLANSGTAPLLLGATNLSGPDFAISSNTCTLGTSLAAAGSCTVSITFTPTAAGARNGTLTISHNATPSTSTVALSGTGATVVQGAPSASLSAAALTFASTNVGSTSASQTVTLTNTGSAALNISGFVLSGSDFSATVTSCLAGTTVAPQAQCSVSVVFTPTAMGSRSGTVTITHNATPATTTLALSGTGAQTTVTAPAATVNATTLAFGDTPVGVQSPSQAVTITNSGTAPLIVSSTHLAPATLRIAASTCVLPQTLAVGASCTLMIAFAPSTTGAVTGSLTIGHNATPSTNTVALTGNGIATSTGLPATRTMVEYVYSPLDYYFITSRPAEQALLDGIAGFQRTGATFLVYVSQQGDMRGINRIYFDKVAKASSRGSHFYTLIDLDMALLMNLNPMHTTAPAMPQYEGVDAFAYPPLVSGVGGSCASGLVPVYRLFRGAARFPDDPNHRYTTSLTVYNQFVASGWDGEGVNFCVPAQ